MKNKRLSCPTLIILYTRERGQRVCGRTGKEKNHDFNNKDPQSDFPINPTEKLSAYLCRIFMQ